MFIDNHTSELKKHCHACQREPKNYGSRQVVIGIAFLILVQYSKYIYIYTHTYYIQQYMCKHTYTKWYGHYCIDTRLIERLIVTYRYINILSTALPYKAFYWVRAVGWISSQISAKNKWTAFVSAVLMLSSTLLRTSLVGKTELSGFSSVPVLSIE